MTTKSNPRKDLNETAFSIVQQATGEVEKLPPTKARHNVRECGLKNGKTKTAPQVKAKFKQRDV